MDRDTALKMIGVRPPYFALQEISTSQFGSSCLLWPEQPVGLEKCRISSAEIGRHLAILGSVELARRNDKDSKSFYLANRASFTRLSSDETSNGAYSASARVHSIDKNNATVQTDLSIESQKVVSLDVDYTILSQKLFERLFRSYKNESFEPKPGSNPYTNRSSFHVVEYFQNELRAKMGPIGPQQCLGHFPGYYAMPVAVLMSSLVQACELLLIELFAITSFSIHKATVEAPSMAIADHSFLDISCRLIEQDKISNYLVAEAKDQSGKDVGRLDIWLNF